MPAYDITVELVDSMGRTGSKRYQTDAATADFTAASSIASGLCDDLQAVTELEVLAYSVSLRTPYAGTLTTGANKDEGATISLRKVDKRKDVIRIPGPIQDFRNGDGTVDITNTDLAAYIANFIATGVTFSDGEKATGVLSGRMDV